MLFNATNLRIICVNEIFIILLSSQNSTEKAAKIVMILNRRKIEHTLTERLKTSTIKNRVITVYCTCKLFIKHFEG